MQSGLTRCFSSSALSLRSVTRAASSGEDFFRSSISRSASSRSPFDQKVRHPETLRHSQGTSWSSMYDLTVSTFRTSNAPTSAPRSQRRAWQCPPFYHNPSKYYVMSLSQARLGCVLTLPVAPQQASRASNSTMLFPFALSSAARYRAAELPVIPLPTMTISASDGRSSVVRWPSKNSFGSLCQNEAVDLGVGRVALGCLIAAESAVFSGVVKLYALALIYKALTCVGVTRRDRCSELEPEPRSKTKGIQST
jgi:hypothetical protein